MPPDDDYMETDPIQIASYWHGGQTSALYSLASTHKLWSEDHRDRCIAEATLAGFEHTAAHDRNDPDIQADLEQLSILIDWLEAQQW